MKTTIELPDLLFRKVKAAAAEEGKSLKDFFTEALRDRLRRQTFLEHAGKPWEVAFGGLRALRTENRRVDRIISEEFETIDEQEWR